MPKYKVLEKSYLPDLSGPTGSSRIFEEGEEVEYEGNPSPSNLFPLCPEGERRMEAHRLNEVKRRSALLGMPDASMMAWSPEMVAQMAAMIGAHGNQPTAVPADVAGPAAATGTGKSKA